MSVLLYMYTFLSLQKQWLHRRIDVVASVTEQSMVQAVKEANEKTSGSEV